MESEFYLPTIALKYATDKNPALNPVSATICHLMAAESSQIGCLLIACICMCA